MMKARRQNDTDLSDCWVGLQGITIVEEFLVLGEPSGTSCGLFCNSANYNMHNDNAVLH